MKNYFLKILIVQAFFFSSIYAIDFKEIITVKLKKDEHKKILITSGKSKKLFSFRWTLYINGGLVVFRSYDRIVGQNILYLEHRNQSFKVELTTKGADFYVVPYILVKFKEFDYETNEAIFQMFLSDKNSKIGLEYLEDK